MVAKRLIWNNILFWCCVLVLSSGFTGCASPPPLKTGGQVSVLYDHEQKAWEDGVKAFEEGDYRKAASIFEMLSTTARIPEIGRRSLYANAATRLLLAQTPEEYADAVLAWEQWNRQALSGLTGEDPRMLTPFIVRLAAPANQGKSDPSVSEGRKIPNAPITNYRGILQSKEKEVESLRTKLEARDREVRRLRHQLESLEEIHRKYQEKKQEASTP